MLARAALARFGDALSVTTSLAGRTKSPGPLPGRVRIGGFGGTRGLAAYLGSPQHRALMARYGFTAVEVDRVL